MLSREEFVDSDPVMHVGAFGVYIRRIEQPMETVLCLGDPSKGGEIILFDLMRGRDPKKSLLDQSGNCRGVTLAAAMQEIKDNYEEISLKWWERNPEALRLVIEILELGDSSTIEDESEEDF